ncbi:MAG TPA: hypothetical protein VK858_05415 [Longimicrobiales bacterium]|nr:hypothetical protein [Longimicrobiales bacterium]
MSDNKKTRRLLLKAMQSESTWLQKALFALGKAEDARESLAELMDEDLEPVRVGSGKKAVSLTEVGEALEQRVSVLMEEVQEERRVLR